MKQSEFKVDLARNRVQIGPTVYELREEVVGEKYWVFRSRKWAWDTGKRKKVRIGEVDEADQDELRPVWLEVKNAARIERLDELLDEARRNDPSVVRFDELGRRISGEEERGEEKAQHRRRGTESASVAKRKKSATSLSSRSQETGPLQVWLLDPSKPHPYVKTREGAWGFVKWTRGKRHPRRRLERHRAAELNRELLRRALAEKVEMPKKRPASFNKLYNTERTYFAPFNIIVSKRNPEDLVIFWRKQAIATISPRSLERLIANLIRLKCEHALWLEEQGTQATEPAEEEAAQEESSQNEDGEDEE